MTLKTEYAHGQFSWVDLVSHDMAAAEKFYGELFGWTTKRLDTQGGPPYAQFELEGKGVGGLGQMSDEMKSQGIPPMWNNYVNVDDIKAATDKAQELGATVFMPPMQVLDAGWLAFFADPTGAALGLWQKNQHFGAELVNSPGAFCWNELATKDIEKAKDFYCPLFGWEAAVNPGAPSKYYIVKNNGEMNGGLMEMTPEWGEIPPHWSTYFTAADVDATVAKVKELGGRVNVEPFDMQVGRMSGVADPQGAAFYVIQLNETPT